ncbi:MAG: 16S rRNA processing protein RimM [Ruminococcus sp.]|nr:16S rRNA processing protein RimM [Ruminococcus sp.]
MKKYLEIGKIVSTHGIKGEVRVQPWCDSSDFLCEFETLYFDEGKKSVDIIRARVQKNVVIMQLDGVDTVEEAQNLRNKILYMDRDDVELDEGTYFIQDLIGLVCIDADGGGEIGKITDVLETGANDVYEITSAEGKKYLIPAIPDVVLETDLDGNTMTIRKMEGLFDDEN